MRFGEKCGERVCGGLGGPTFCKDEQNRSKEGGSGHMQLKIFHILTNFYRNANDT